MTFRRVDFGSEEHRAMGEFRWRWLREPLGLEFSPGELEAETSDWHLAGFSPDGRLVSCVIFTPAGEGRVKMRQFAVHPDWRGTGLGGRFLAWAEAFAAERGVRHIYCHARDTARRFYERAGYRAVGEPFTEVGLRHWRMERVL